MDEEGSEAAAVAAAISSNRMSGSGVAVDRPFVFMIYDKTFQAPLFVGRIMKPQEPMPPPPPTTEEPTTQGAADNLTVDAPDHRILQYENEQ